MEIHIVNPVRVKCFQPCRLIGIVFTVPTALVLFLADRCERPVYRIIYIGKYIPLDVIYIHIYLCIYIYAHRNINIHNHIIIDTSRSYSLLLSKQLLPLDATDSYCENWEGKMRSLVSAYYWYRFSCQTFEIYPSSIGTSPKPG